MSPSTFKTLVKSAAIHGFHVSGLTRAANYILAGTGAILTFHEIQDDPSEELWTGCRTAFLVKCIGWLRRTGWEIVTLSEAVERLQRNVRIPRFVVLTFDDGYRDNISGALPVLRREQAPFTIYVPTGAISRELFAWWLGLRELFRTNEKVEIAAMNISFSCTDLSSKMWGLAFASRWVHENYNRTPDLRDTFSAYGVSVEALCDRYFMNEDELLELAREPLASIGAHTVTHPALSILDAADVSREMVDNRNFLQARLGIEVVDLAYPFGNPRACGLRGRGSPPKAVSGPQSPRQIGHWSLRTATICSNCHGSVSIRTGLWHTLMWQSTD